MQLVDSQQRPGCRDECLVRSCASSMIRILPVLTLPSIGSHEYSSQSKRSTQAFLRDIVLPAVRQRCFSVAENLGTSG